MSLFFILHGWILFITQYICALIYSSNCLHQFYKEGVEAIAMQQKTHKIQKWTEELNKAEDAPFIIFNFRVQIEKEPIK